MNIITGIIGVCAVALLIYYFVILGNCETR